MGGRLLRAPLQSKYKGLLNLSYYTNMKKWQFDFTTQFNGPGRIPVPVSENSGQADRFDSFRIMNAQISKFFRKWSIYAGCENIGDFTQNILSWLPTVPGVTLSTLRKFGVLYTDVNFISAFASD